MTTDFTESDEDAVSDGMTMPEQPCTDDLPHPLDQQAPSEKAPSAAPSPRKTTRVVEQIRIGNLTLTVDDPDFAYALQCGIIFAQHRYRRPETSMRHVMKRFLTWLEEERDEDGQIEDYTRWLGMVFGEISYLLTGVKRLHVDFNRSGPEREVP